MNTSADQLTHDVGKILGTTASTVVSSAEELLSTLIKMPEFEDKNRTGGYLTLMAKFAEELLLCCRIGTIPHLDDANPKYQTKAKKYLHCSQEKPKRLIGTNYTLTHLSSWQSRDESKDEYGGSVWCDKFAVSFSGLPELADEALCLLLSIHFDWMSTNRASEIAGLSDNPHFKPLLLAWHEAGHAGPVPIT